MTTTMTKAEFFNQLDSLRCAQFISMVTETKPTKKPKKNCPYDIRKIGVMAGRIGCSYANGVNNQLGREDKDMVFVAKPRKWGTLMPNKNMVQHIPEGETEMHYYVDMQVQSAQKPIYIDVLTERELTKEEYTPWIPKKYASKTQVDAGVTKEIPHRDVALDSIVSIKMGGETYQMVREQECLGRIEAVKVRVEAYQGQMTEQATPVLVDDED